MTVRTIAPAALERRLRARPDLELIDVRTPAEFNEVHLPAARNLPLDRLDPGAWMRARRTGPESADEPVYVICQSGARGAKACARFLEVGFPNVVNVEGGTLAAIEAGLPVIRGKGVMSLERQVRIAAGSLVVLSVLLAWLVHPVLLGLAVFVGAGLIFAGITDTCGMALLLARMPWNQRAPGAACVGGVGRGGALS